MSISSTFYTRIFCTRVLCAVFFYLLVTREKLQKRLSYEKGVHKMLVKLTLDVNSSRQKTAKCETLRHQLEQKANDWAPTFRILFRILGVDFKIDQCLEQTCTTYDPQAKCGPSRLYNWPANPRWDWISYV